MAYVKTTWTNDSGQSINADNLNKIEQGIFDKQDQLISGTNIKTVDGVSIVGSGDIPIIHPSDIVATSNTTNGYVTLSNGLIMQWGVIAVTTLNNTTVTFPIVFPNACFTTFTTNIYAGQTYEASSESITTSGFVANSYNNISMNWFAIGY
jgi:hypothetical protein